MGIARIGEIGDASTLKVHQRRKGAFCWTLWIPCPGHGINLLSHAARKPSDHVDLVDGLAEQHPSSFFGAQLLRASGTIQEVSVVKGLDHSQLAELAARDQLRGQLDRRIETVAGPNDQVNPRLVRGGDHGLGVFHRDRERLFHENVLSSARRGQNVIYMHLVRGGDVDRFHRWIGA